MNSAHPVTLIVAGPTCSGKSALALFLARCFNGVIINADSMQVYRDLHVLTARPDAADEASVPHRLYGVLDAEQAGSVAWWRERALSEMAAAWGAGRLPILCGGTGMYLRALTDGLVEIPDPGEAARGEARGLLEAIGAEALHERLMEADPETAAGLRAGDGQRIARAWEVWRGTGRGMVWWRGQPGLPAAACRFVAVRLDPARDLLRAALASRFEAMLAGGALDEVSALAARGLDPALPAMRAHGVPELMAYLRGEIGLEEASRRAVLAIGRYTRRQATWFRHHSLAAEGDDEVFSGRWDGCAQQMESRDGKMETFVRARIDVEGASDY